MGKEEQLISIIIPVYNVALYLEECMNSVLQQTYQNLEVILVDDGSTDGSENLCDWYAEYDKRVKVIHKKNEGQAVARNIGIDMADGKYIAFVDSDDVLDIRYIELLYDALRNSNADISMCYYRKFKGNLQYNAQELSYSTQIYDEEQVLEELCYQRFFNNGPVVKLFKSEIVKDIYFPPNLGYEDFATIYKYIAKANRIILIKQKLYFYRQRQGSTMYEKFNKKKLDRMYISNELLTFIKEKYPRIEEAAEVRVFVSNLQVIMNMPLRKQYEAYWKQAMDNVRRLRKSVLMNSKAKKTVRLMAAVSYMGKVPLKCMGTLYDVLINKRLSM